MNKYLLSLIVFSFVVLSLSLTVAVECNADLSNAVQGATLGCDVTSSLTLNGTYNVNINTTGNAIRIFANNVIFDCNGSTIYGNFSSGSTNGISASNKINVTIQNCIFSAYRYDFNSFNATNLTLNNFYANNSIYYSLLDSSVLGYVWINNSYFNNGGTDGLYVRHSKNVYLTNNTFTNSNYFGVFSLNNSLLSLVNSTIQNNSLFQDISTNSFNISIDGLTQIGGLSRANNNFVISLTNVTNSSFTNLNSNGMRNFFFATGTNSIIVSDFNIQNATSNQFFLIQYSSNFNILNGIFNLSDTAITLADNVNNSLVQNNTFYNSIAGYDGFTTHIRLDRGVNNNIIQNNTFGISTIGILNRQSNNNIFRYNTFLSGTQSQRLSAFQLVSGVNNNDGFEPYCAIGVLEGYKTYFSSNVGDEKITTNHLLASDNITLLGNIFDSNTQCYLRTQGTTNLTHDLSGYWINSWQSPQLLDIDTIYANNLFSNISNINKSYAINNFLGQGRYISNYNNANITTLYQIFKSYSYYKNNNGLFGNLTNLFNLTSALLTNGTSLCNGSSSNLALNTGQVNITLLPNGFCYVFDDFDSVTDFNLLVSLFGIDKTNALYETYGYLKPTDVSKYDSENNSILALTKTIRGLGMLATVIIFVLIIFVIKFSLGSNDTGIDFGDAFPLIFKVIIGIVICILIVTVIMGLYS